MQRLPIGELDVLIMGNVLPIRNAPRMEQRAIAETLIERLSERIARHLPSGVEFSIVSIQDGCIRVKFNLALTLSGAFDEASATVARYADFTQGVRALWEEGNEVLEFIAEGRACNARFAGARLTERLHGPVPENASLSQIVAELDWKGNTREQAMVAIFEANRECFIDDHIDRPKPGSLLAIPTPPSIAEIPVQRANMRILKQMRRSKRGEKDASQRH